MLREVGARDLAHVLALVAIVGKRRARARRLAHAGLHRQREIRDLRTGIVVIELAMDAVALRFHQARDRIANRRGRVHGPHAAGPVGFAETNSTMIARLCAAATRPVSHRARSRIRATTARRAVSERNTLMNPAPAISTRATHGEGLERGDQRRRQLARIALERLGQLQRDVA